MPEGPEIRRIADWIAGAITGQTIESITVGPRKARADVDELVGATITAVEPRAKAIVIHTDAGWSLFTHTQLYGRWYVLEPDEEPSGDRKVGVTLKTPDRKAMLCSTSRVEVWRTKELDEHKFLSSLGPDVLDEKVEVEDIDAILVEHDGRALGTTLLDQSAFAGIGNYLRSEILWVAQEHPDTKIKDLDEAQRRAVAEAILELPRRSYRTEGYTTDEEHIARGEAQGLGKKELKRYVYKHDGDPCPRCQTTIVKGSSGGRAVYLCPSCQPEP